jgi:YidC/Oxa1 family membrane protein insertase
MERRVLLAISLSFLVLFAYQSYFAPAPPAPAGTSTSGVPGTGTEGAAAPTSPAPGSMPAPTPGAAPPAAPSTPAPALTVEEGEGAERDITVETRSVRAVFTNRGARIKHWILKQYENDEGEPLDLVPSADSVNNAFMPFSLRLDDPALTSAINGGLYRTEASGAVDGTGGTTTLRFGWRGAGGLQVTKSFTLQPDGYIVGFTAAIVQNGQPVNPIVEWGPGLGDDNAHASAGSFLAPSYSTPAQALLHRDRSVTRFTTPGTEEGPFLFAGIDDHYFAALALNDPARLQTLRFSHTSFVVPPRTADAAAGRYAAFAVQYPQPPENQRFFFGPKAFDELRAIDTELVRVINFGMFSVLAVPLLGALKWVYQYVGNWGWAIIALTVLINLAMFPLRQKAVTSMRRMQEIQPQMKAIQERYAKYKITDPQRQKMNEEVMALYKEKGVNPASGCVPMLLTFPFLFAFYAMLSQAIEIRGADFFGWITDLSRPDPLFITPLIMGATMFWQQKITPTSADPVQQRVMMIMPVMFTFMFLSYPSGLVIYWTISNIWAIGQQLLTTRLVPAKTKS